MRRGGVSGAMDDGAVSGRRRPQEDGGARWRSGGDGRRDRRWGAVSFPFSPLHLIHIRVQVVLHLMS